MIPRFFMFSYYSFTDISIDEDASGHYWEEMTTKGKAFSPRTGHTLAVYEKKGG